MLCYEIIEDLKQNVFHSNVQGQGSNNLSWYWI